jgi:flagellar motor switch protein FliN/FliY
LPLSDEQQNQFTQLSQELMTPLASVLTMLLNTEASVSLTGVGESTIQSGNISAPENIALIQAQLSSDPSSPIFFITTTVNAEIIAALMMGQEPGAELDADKQEAFLSAVSQALAESLNQFKAKTLSISKFNLQMIPVSHEVDLGVGTAERVDAVFNIQLANGASVDMILNISTDHIAKLCGAKTTAGPKPQASQQQSQAANDDYATVGDFMGADFAEIIDSHNPDDIDEKKNLNLLLDIRLGLIVELGRTEMHLKEILKLTKGSIIELDRLSGEPVDLFVNNKLIARGEVVVIDDNFGLRITQLAGTQKAQEKELGLIEGYAGN